MWDVKCEIMTFIKVNLTDFKNLSGFTRQKNKNQTLKNKSKICN